MRSANYALRKKYFSLLSGITYNSVAVPVFSQKAPDNVNAENYIVFGGISSSDDSGQYKADTETSINVTIHSYKQNSNDGAAADSIANEVLTRIYPNKQTQPDLSADSLQCVSTLLANDYTQNYNIMGGREYIDRVLTFRHHIFHQ